ncbi:hypothetical protein FA13DRAFT_1704116 [Coprinellus micaceus]|uniref:Uncharacterized protein n=1 Tax=Coprinellus micaceus TaxID=71717 RepID=A0A4Y7U2H1_COPMI|nr:hypothetical protein FA13DRAFT_1704116 [Coprinellus micaceus]
MLDGTCIQSTFLEPALRDLVSSIAERPVIDSGAIPIQGACLSPATPSIHRARRPLPKPTTPFVTPEDKENLNFARHHIMLVHSRRNHETDSSTLAVTPSHMRIDPQTRAVVGAVIGSVVAIILAVVAFLLWRRCRTLQPSLGKGDQENPGTPSDVVDGKSSQGEKGGESDQGRPSSVYSGRPLSDPFAAEVKTAEKDTPSTPEKGEASTINIPSPPSVANGADPASEALKRPAFDRRTSTEISGIPRLSKTFVAKVRATTRSPPPV